MVRCSSKQCLLLSTAVRLESWLHFLCLHDGWMTDGGEQKLMLMGYGDRHGIRPCVASVVDLEDC
jgi:hypothetical protein